MTARIAAPSVLAIILAIALTACGPATPVGDAGVPAGPSAQDLQRQSQQHQDSQKFFDQQRQQQQQTQNQYNQQVPQGVVPNDSGNGGG